MDGKNIKKLEELVVIAIEELQWLRSQNDALRQDLGRRKTDLDNTQKDSDKVKKKLKRITELEKENKRLKSGQALVRKKVGNILNQLEKADFI